MADADQAAVGEEKDLRERELGQAKRLRRRLGRRDVDEADGRVL